MTLSTKNDILPPGNPGSAEIAMRYFSAISGAMRAELFENRLVPVPGFGVFLLRHCPAERRSGRDGVAFLPPRNQVVFEKRVVSDASFIRMISSRILLQQEETERLAVCFPALLNTMLQERGEIVFPGFGRFVSEPSGFMFTADQALDGLLNSEYHDLEAIPLSSHASVWTLKQKGVLLYTASGVVLLILAGFFFFFVLQQNREFYVSEQRTAKKELPSRPEIFSGSMPVADEGHPSSGSGFFLQPGEYTVVLATYRKKQTAERERIRFDVPGSEVFIWPVTGNGRQYYRLAAGRFPNRGKAEAWMDSTGLGRTGKAYIQQANRRVVLHGEKGL